MLSGQTYELLKKNLDAHLEDLHNACLALTNECIATKKYCEDFCASSDEKNELDLPKIANFTANLQFLALSYLGKNDPQTFAVLNSVTNDISNIIDKLSHTIDNNTKKEILIHELLFNLDGIKLNINAGKISRERTLLIQFDKDCHPEYAVNAEKILAELANLKKQVDALTKQQKLHDEPKEKHSSGMGSIFHRNK